MQEKTLTAFFKSELVKAKICHWKVSDRYNKGRPDFEIFVNGLAIGVELKSQGKKPTPIQRMVGNDMMENGGAIWLWISTKEQARRVVESLRTLKKIGPCSTCLKTRQNLLNYLEGNWGSTSQKPAE